MVLVFGLRKRWLDALLTAGTVVLLLWSRFGLLPSGPWEWDETLFANGIYYFSLAAHYPQPPGFPGWIALGHLFSLFTPTPLHALQAASALLSILALWPLAALGRRVAPPIVAAAAAVFFLLLPGIWLHAGRGFSSIPAATFALFAAALPVKKRPTSFTLLLTAAFLIRPILLPGLAVLWLGGAWTVRPRRRLLPGVGIGLGGLLAAIAVMAHAEGGLAPFVRAFAVHAETHAHNLARNAGGWLQLGLVKGFGGGIWAAALLTLAMVGLAAWGQRVSRRGAALWAAVLLVTVLQLVFLQNRTYTRYAVPVQLALAPLVAGGVAALLPEAGAVAVLVLATALAGTPAYALVAEQHVTELPGWRAVKTGMETARREGEEVVAEAGLYPFADYLSHVMGSGAPAADPPLVLSPWAPAPFAGVDRPYLVVTNHPEWYLGSLIGREWRARGVSDELKPFTQGRFLEAAVIADPPLPTGQWWFPEKTPTGGRFMWGSAGAGLILPPLPEGTGAWLDLRPAAGDAQLIVRCNGRELSRVDGRAGRVERWVAPDSLDADEANKIVFAREATYAPGRGDRRPLAVQLFGAGIVGPRVPWRGPVATERQRRHLRIDLDGAYAAERFGGEGWGCWVRPRAELRFAAGPGSLEIDLAAPRPTSPRLRVRIGDREAVGPFTVEPGRRRELQLGIRPEDLDGGVLRVQLESVPYRPSAAGRSGDDRNLGVVLFAVGFRPEKVGDHSW